MDIATPVRSVPVGVVLFFLILLPWLAGLAVYIVKNRIFTVAVVVGTAWALTLSALLLFGKGAFEKQNITPFEPGSIAGIPLESVLKWADLALMCAFVAIGLRRRSALLGLLALAQLLPMAWVELWRHPAANPGAVFTMDWLAICMVMIVSVIGSIVAVYALPYMKDHEEHLHLEGSRQPRFFLFILLFLGAMNGLVLANNLLWLCFFWELTTLCSYMLIGHDGTEEAAANAGRALWMNLTGGVAFAAAIVLLAVRANTVSLTEVLAGAHGGTVPLLAVACLCFAGFTKAAQMPFQSWLLGAMVAPTPVSALLHSSTMVKAGVYLVVRLAPAFRGTELSVMVAAVGAFTFVSGALLAIGQNNAKRVLAYSTISNLGLIVACAGLSSHLAITAAVMLIVFHALSKGLLFMAAGVVEHSIWSRDIEEMQGLVQKLPATTILMVIGILSMLLPPFGVLIAKLAAIQAAISQPGILVFLVIGSTLTLVFWTKWTGRLLTTEPGSPRPRWERLHSMYFVPLLALGAGTICFSLLVAPILTELVEPAVNQAFAMAPAPEQTGLVSTAVVNVPWLGLFAVTAVVFTVPYLALRGAHAHTRAVYLCGDQTALADGIGFRSVAEQPTSLTLHGDYYERWVGESRHVRWMTATAVVLLVALFGVTAL